MTLVRSRNRFLSAFLLLTLGGTGILVSCQELDVSAVDVGNVTVSPPSASIEVGAQRPFAAEVTDVDGNTLKNRAVTWSSTDASVATVTAAGEVTGVATGTASIHASVDGITGEASVTVSPAQVATVEITPASPSVAAAATLQLQATARSAGGLTISGRPVSWASADPAIASVDGNGLLRGVAEGSTTITASVDGRTGQTTATVTPATIATITIAPPAANLPVGSSLKLSAQAKTASGAPVTGRTIAWSSSAPGVATVDATGLVRGVATGAATVTASADGVTGQASITVVQATVDSVEVAPASATTTIAGSVQLQAVARSVDGTVLSGRAATWTSADAAVATVNGTGLVTGVALGNTTVTATIDGVSGKATIFVAQQPVSTVEIQPATDTIEVDGTQVLTAVLKGTNGAVLINRQVTWTSSNSGIASVAAASNGATATVTGVAPGPVTITATAEGIAGQAAITVIPKPVATVKVTPASSSLVVTDTVRLKATTLAADGSTLTGRPVTWATNAGAVATVSTTGLVKAVGVGAAVITATSEGVSGQAGVTVGLQPVATIEVTPPSLNLIEGDSATLAVVLKASNGNVLTGRLIQFSSSKSTVARVGPTGRVTAVAAGSATITVTSENITKPVAVTVTLRPVASVTVQPATAKLFVGDATAFQAVLKAANGQVLTGRAVAWKSSNTTVASVSGTAQTGTVTALDAGTSTITATTGGVSGSATVTVDKHVGSVVVTPASSQMFPGDTKTLQAVVKATDGTTLTNRTVTWASGNAAIATVASSGGLGASATVTAVAAQCPKGQLACAVTITATADGVNGTATVNVAKLVATITIQPGSATLRAGDQAALKALPAAADGTVLTDRTVTWSSADAAIATVTASGQFGQDATVTVATAPCTGQPSCTVDITASAGGKSASATITIEKPVATITLTPPTGATLQPQQTAAYRATTKAADGTVLTNRTVSWTTSTSAVATVTPSGIYGLDATVTAVAAACPAGTAVCKATITASAEGKSAAVTISVPKSVATVAVDPDSVTLTPGATQQFTGEARAADGTPLPGFTVAWSSSDPAIATVGASSGLVTAVSASQCPSPATSCEATITASAGGGTGTAEVVVLKLVAKITIDPPTQVTLGPGDTHQFAAKLEAADGTDLTGVRKATWKSSDTATAKVDATGLVTAVAGACPAGNATCAVTITVSADGQSATADVTVVKPVATVELNPASLDLDENASAPVQAVPKAADGTPLTAVPVTWVVQSGPLQVSTSGSANQDATVSAPNNACPQGSATCNATVTATAETITATLPVTVHKTVANIALSPNPAPDLDVGATLQLTATLTAADNTDLTGVEPVTWSSADPNTATVDANGLVTAVGAPCTGQTKCSVGITADAGTKSRTLTVNVREPVASITIHLPAGALMQTNQSQQATAQLFSADGTSLNGTMRTVSWSIKSSVPANALTISPTNGETVTIQANVLAALVTIEATAEGQSGSVLITIIP